MNNNMNHVGLIRLTYKLKVFSFGGNRDVFSMYFLYE